jgi:hypothetical protein
MKFLKTLSKTFYGIVYPIAFWAFLAIKVGGVSFTAWSWLWVLLPPVPLIGLLVKHWGL